jgi:hypothetical protein
MLFHNKLCTIASEQKYNKPITSGTCFLSTAAFANSATLLSDLCSRSTVGEKLFEHSKQESNYFKLCFFGQRIKCIIDGNSFSAH